MNTSSPYIGGTLHPGLVLLPPCLPCLDQVPPTCWTVRVCWFCCYNICSLVLILFKHTTAGKKFNFFTWLISIQAEAAMWKMLKFDVGLTSAIHAVPDDGSSELGLIKTFAAWSILKPSRQHTLRALFIIYVSIIGYIYDTHQLHGTDSAMT